MKPVRMLLFFFPITRRKAFRFFSFETTIISNEDQMYAIGLGNRIQGFSSCYKRIKQKSPLSQAPSLN